MEVFTVFTFSLVNHRESDTPDFFSAKINNKWGKNARNKLIWWRLPTILDGNVWLSFHGMKYDEINRDLEDCQIADCDHIDTGSWWHMVKPCIYKLHRGNITAQNSSKGKFTGTPYSWASETMVSCTVSFKYQSIEQEIIATLGNAS